MASYFLLIVLLVLIFISVTSTYSLSTRDAGFKKYDDESYFIAASEQGLPMIDVADLAKARSLQALVVGSKVIVNKAFKSKGWMKKKHKSSKVGSLDVLTLVGIIIAAVLATIVIICLLCNFLSKAQSVGQGEVGTKELDHGMDEKTITVDMSAPAGKAGKLSNGDTNA